MSADQIKAYMPAISNAILMILANKTSKDLLNREGKEQLALEIMREAVRPMGIEVAAPEPITVAQVDGRGERGGAKRHRPSRRPPPSATAPSATRSSTSTSRASSFNERRRS